MLILASASPRRQELLRLVTEDFSICTRDTDESLPPGTAPAEGVRVLARRKALAVAADYPGHVVLGADTVVAVDGDMLGKPANAEDAAAMLRRLSGRRHQVYTGVAIVYPGGESVFAEETTVDFLPLTEEDIRCYVATGEPMDKAGAYGIQGRGALFIRGISGDYYNVMGLPVCRLAQLLRQLGMGNLNIL